MIIFMIYFLETTNKLSKLSCLLLLAQRYDSWQIIFFHIIIDYIGTFPVQSKFILKFVRKSVPFKSVTSFRESQACDIGKLGFPQGTFEVMAI